MRRCLLPLLLILLAPVAWAAAGPVARVDNPHTRVEIYTETATVRAGEPLWVAVRFAPTPGWHTYWKNYGDSGKEPGLHWQLPPGWQATEALYPVPERIPVGPLMNYGYERPQSLLVALTPPVDAPPGPLSVGLDAEWLVCEEICVPEDGQFRFEIAVGETAGPPLAPDIFAAARGELPRPSPWTASARMSASAFRLDIDISPSETALVENAYFFPLDDGLINYAAPQKLTISDAGLALAVARPEDAPEMASARGVLAISNAHGDREGFSLNVPIASDPVLTVAGTTGVDLGLWTAALFAFLGGMLLNLMPCVFPVLSLKAFALVRAHGAGAAAARRDGLAYGAGIVTSFLVVAGVFLALRSAGAAIGWGFQLQSPWVVTLLALILFILGLSLVGFVSLGARLSGLGEGLASQGGLRGAFFTGVLATVGATPCTAPFMAPALGYAVFQPTPVALAVFLSLGLGLAAPYLLLAFVPGMRRLLPKPGPWLETFRQFLAFPMFLTVIWLLWVLGQEAGSEAVALALVAMLGTAFLIWLWRAGTRFGMRGRGAVAVLGLALAVPFVHAGNDLFAADTAKGEGASRAAADFKQALGVEPWSPERVDALRAEGHPVFVYFTAAWCITCQVNERITFDNAKVAAFVSERGIAMLEADWTNEDPRITKALARFGRNGVPLYLYYRRGARAPVILPQILTPDIFMSRIDAASRNVAES